jgi:tetratricopeptide (TPR) repeat protein
MTEKAWLAPVPLIKYIPQMTVPSSTFSNSNMVGLFLAITLPLSVCSWVLSKGAWMKRASQASLVSGGLLLMCTKTRGAWLAAMAVAVILVWYKYFWQRGRLHKLRYVLACGCLMVVAAYFPLRALDTGSPTLRWIWWKNTAVMIKDHPLWGVGLGNFKIIYPRYVSAAKDLNFSENKDWSFTETNQLTRVHNDHLQMLAELGCAGFLPYALMFFLFAGMFRKIFKQSDDRTRLIALCTALSVLAFCIVATTNFPFERALPPLYLFMCFAVLSFLYKKQPAAGALPGNAFWQKTRAAIVNPRDMLIPNPGLQRLVRAGLVMLLLVFTGCSFYFIRKVVLADRYFVEALARTDRIRGIDTTGTVSESTNELLQQANDLLIKAIDVFSDWNFNISALLGRNRTMQENYEGALEAYRESLRVHPNNVNAILNTGYCCLKLGRLDEAELYFKRFLEFMPDVQKGHNNLGIVYFSKREYAQAINCYKKAFALDPSYAEAHFNLANVYRSQGRVQDALQEYETALKIKPELNDVRSILISAYVDRGDFAQAEKTIAPLLQNKETAAEARVMLGGIYQQNGLYEKALLQYLTAAELAPEEAVIYHNIGLMHFHLKNYDKAEKSFEIATRLNPSLTDSYTMLGQLHLQRQDDEGALALFLKALETDPRNKDLYFNVGTIYLRAGDLDEAMRRYTEAIKIDPSYSLAHYNLGTILRHQGNKMEALYHFQKALEKPAPLIDVELARKFIDEIKASIYPGAKKAQ